MGLGEALMRFGSALWGSFGPGEYEAAGKAIACAHCGGLRFQEGRAQLTTSSAQLGPIATTLGCVACGRIEWWVETPKRTRDAR